MVLRRNDLCELLLGIARRRPHTGRRHGELAARQDRAADLAREREQESHEERLLHAGPLASRYVPDILVVRAALDRVFLREGFRDPLVREVAHVPYTHQNFPTIGTYI